MRTTMIYKHILIAITLAIISTSVLADKKIPMIDKKYNGKYFLISNKKKGGINLVIYKSVFSTETVYSKMEINCSTGKYRKIEKASIAKAISQPTQIKAHGSNLSMGLATMM